MPGKNGTGPFGMGSMTGRGFGLCAGNGLQTRPRFGLGFGCRRGFGNGFNQQGNMVASTNANQLLQQNLVDQKRFLEKRLQEVNHDLESYEKNTKTNADD